MPWRWPFERRSEAEAPQDATERWLEDLYRDTDRAIVWETAIVEAAAGLWARALASAAVSPMAPALAGVSPEFLAWAGRALILRGEAVALIEIADGRAVLLPALAHDVDGAADPAAWMYRLDIAGPSSHRSRRVPGAGVVHFKWAVRSSQPWRGLSPVRQAKATGDLHARLTTTAAYFQDPRHGTAHVRYEQTGQIGGRANPTNEQAKQIAETIHDLRTKHARDPAALPIVRGAAIDSPRRDTVQDAEEKLFEGSAGQILAACGVPPQLLSHSGEATITREAWRLFVLSAVQPVARMMEAEMRGKLHPEAMLEFAALRASDLDQQSRAHMRKAQAYAALKKADMDASHETIMARLRELEAA